MNAELFVYYRVHVDDAAEALAVAQRCQQRMRDALPGLTARLLRRPGAADAHLTWMETYRLESAGGIDTAAQREIEALAEPLARFIRGARHLEAFVPCA